MINIKFFIEFGFHSSKLGLGRVTRFLEYGRILGEILGETFKISVAVIGNTGLVLLWIEDESWVSANLDTISLVNGGIKFGDDEVLLVFILLTELFPNWGKLLAVSAPWGVELDKDILGWVHDDFLELLSDNNGDWIIVRLWNLLRFKVWTNFTGKDVISPLSDNIDGQISWLSIAFEFLHLLWEDGHKSWQLLLGDTHELSESLLDTSFNIGVCEEHLTLVGLGGISKDGHESGVLIGSSISE